MTALVIVTAIGAIAFGLAVVAAYIGGAAARRDAFDQAASVLDAAMGNFEDARASSDKELLGVLRRTGATRPIRAEKSPAGGPFEWAMERERLLNQEYGQDYFVSSVRDIPSAFLTSNPRERDRLVAALSLIRDREDSPARSDRHF